MGVKGRKTAKGYFEGSKWVAVYALATCQILCYSVYGAAQRQAVSHIPGKGVRPCQLPSRYISSDSL